MLAATLFIVLFLNDQQLVAANRAKSLPVDLNEDSWSQLLTGEWMVDFYAPWCPACKNIKPEWEKLSEWSDDLNIKVAWADVTQNPGLSGRFMVSGLPTIYHVKDGQFRLYTGPRDHKSIINLIEQQGWRSIQPVSRWLSPSSFQMSFVAHSFRISMALRDVHNYLVDEVGLPYYVSYSVFALCTVTLGTLLGLLIVFIIDLFCPSRCPSAIPEASPKTKRLAASKAKDSDSSESEVVKKKSSDVEDDTHLTRRKVN